SRQLGEAWRERDTDPLGVATRLAQGQRPPPRAAGLQPGREGDLADEPIAPLGPCERGFDESRQCTPQRQLVADRFRELERGGDDGGRAATAHARGRPTSRQAPGAPAVRPQTFGDGATRKPGKLPQLAYSERLE